MQCRFCLFQNPEDEERCHRCHKRLSGDITFDGVSLEGTVAPARRRTSVIDIPNEGVTPPAPRRAARAAAAVSDLQTSLFNGEFSSNVIPFEVLPRPTLATQSGAVAGTELLPDIETGPVARNLNTAKQTIRKQVSNRRTSDSHIDNIQGSLNLLPAPQTPRILKTTVEASIYCDAGVATPMHRFIASALDASMILIGCGIFLAMFQCFGGGIRVDKFDLAMLTCALVLITMLYGFVFAMCGRETAGQSWTKLRLINFDGFPPDDPAVRSDSPAVG